MSHHRALKQSLLAVGVLAMLLASSDGLSYGNQCQPQTPCPCEADGVCRPKRDTWGYSQTRWRSWPGDPAGQQPTAAGDAAGTGPGQGLEPFELPLPKQEDLRGPAKSDKDKKEDGDAQVNAPVNAPVNEIPIGEIPIGEIPVEAPAQALPAFDPQGSQLELPKTPGMDDAPPALPASLQQAGVTPQTPIQNLPQIATRPVRQVNWQQSHSIQLINPASAIVTSPKEATLQRAIYYEASGN